MWDKLKSIAKRAGLDPTTVWLHKWRATAATNWLRCKELGGEGWDIGYVRQRLGHEDMKSIEFYIAIVSNEEMVLRDFMQKKTAALQIPPTTLTTPLKPGLEPSGFDISAGTRGWHRA
jgi:integrase